MASPMPIPFFFVVTKASTRRRVSSTDHPGVNMMRRFAETIIDTLFGYAAKPGAKLTLMTSGCDEDSVESCVM
jgi:hypothetical protein